MKKPSLAGRIAYQLYYRPLGVIKKSLNEGGPYEQWLTRQGQLEMEQAAYNLPDFDSLDTSRPLTVHLLTGDRYWYQSMFCLYSLQSHTPQVLAPVFHSDGSLKPDQEAALLEKFSYGKVITPAACRQHLEQHLPADKFPYLNDRRIHYPHIRKLTDVHAGHHGWKLVIDSDLLFFKQPTVLIDWLNAPTQPLHAVDIEESYGYPRTTMESLAGHPIPNLLNVGLCGLQSDSIDWEQVEYWTRELVEQHGTSYYLEQALVAMLAAGRECAIAPKEEYITLPDSQEAQSCNAVMHHYVALSKKWYFRENWKKCTQLKTSAS